LDPEMRQVAGKMVEDTERFILQIDEWLRPIDQP
jgi:hypothetical protein